MNIKDAIGWLSGKKTYIIAFVALIYGCGIEQGWWQHNAGLDLILGALGVGTMRAAIAKVGGSAVEENAPADGAKVTDNIPPSKGVPIIFLACLLAGSSCYAQTNEPPAITNAAPPTLSIGTFTALMSALKDATVLTSGYGITVDGKDRGVVFAQQLTLFNINLKRLTMRWGMAHCTLFTSPVNIEEIGTAVSWEFITPPKSVSDALNVAKPITPSFSKIYGWGGVFQPFDNVVNADFDGNKIMLGAGLGVTF